MFLFTREVSPGIWSNLEDLTVYQDQWNLPNSVAITLQADAVPRIFWRQSFHDNQMQPSGEGMYTKYLSNGSWQDDSEVLQGHVGNQVDVATGAQEMPVYVWTEKDNATHRVLVNLYRPISSVPSSRAADSVRLAAHPNPFSDMLTINWSSPGAGRAYLSLFDIHGRIVARILNSAPRGRESAFSWSPEDSRGGPLPNGVYFLRLETDAGSRTERIVHKAIQ